MIQKEYFICNSKNPKLINLLSRLDKLVIEKDKQIFSDNFNHLISDYNLDQLNWQDNFVGEHSSEIIETLGLFFDLW